MKRGKNRKLHHVHTRLSLSPSILFLSSLDTPPFAFSNANGHLTHFIYVVYGLRMRLQFWVPCHYDLHEMQVLIGDLLTLEREVRQRFCLPLERSHMGLDSSD